MIVRSLADVEGTDFEISAAEGQWLSRRLLVKKDGMGFSLHDTIVYPGRDSHLWYKNHLEAVYCIEGSGEIEVLSPTPGKYLITPGTVYALDKHDKHILRAKMKMRIICVFNPPCVGNEIHNEDGSYTA